MADETVPTININYLKSAHYQEVPCDGVIGAATPHGKLWMAFYAERGAIPQVVMHKLTQTGQDGEFRLEAGDVGVPVEGRTGMVRNLEVGVYMNVDTAREFHKWLGMQLAALTEGENK